MFLEVLKDSEVQKFFRLKQGIPSRKDRVAWEAVSPEDRNRWLALADEALGKTQNWTILSATKFMLVKRTGDREIYERELCARRDTLQALMLGEIFRDDGRYMDDIVNAVLAICEETFWGYPAHNYTSDVLFDFRNPFIDLYVSETGALLTYVLLLLGDKIRAVSKALYERVLFELDIRIKKPFLTRTDYWWMGYDNSRLNNWTPWIVSNILSIFFYEEENITRVTKAIEKSALLLDRFISGYTSDGGCDEGADYWSHAGGRLFDCLEILYTSTDGKVNFYHYPIVAEIGRYIYRAGIFGEYYFNFADCSAKAVVDYEMVFRFARRIEDQKMAVWAAKHFSDERSKGIYKFRPLHRELPILFDREILAWANEEATVFRDFYFSGLEVAIARQYTVPDRGFYLVAKGGHNGESHNHNDVGNYIIYHNGSPLVVDVGVGTYRRETFDSRRYTIWTMQSAYHNLPIVNNTMQSAGKIYGASEVKYTCTDEEVNFSENIALAYPLEAGIKHLERKFIFDRRKDGKIEIIDEFHFEREGNEIIECLLLVSYPERLKDGFLLTTYDGSKVKLMIDKVFSAEIEKIAIEDVRLQRVWGDALYRMKLSVKTEKKLQVKFCFLPL